MITLQIILFLTSIIGLAANGYFFRWKNLTGVFCGFLMTVPSTLYSLWNHSLSEMIDATPIQLVITTSICLFVWGFGYGIAWITENDNDNK